MKKKQFLNFAVGPVMMEQSTIETGNKQIPYFRTKEFSDLMLENEKIILELVNAKIESRTIFLTASGTGAMEAAVINCLDEEDKILIVNGGTFGERFVKICKKNNLNYEEIKLNNFQELTLQDLSIYENQGFTTLLINLHETSTGVLYDSKIVSEFCARNNIFLIVDAISTFLADEYDMNKIGANVTVLSSQKAIALPPGIALLIVDPEAQKRILRNYTESIYFDLKEYLIDGKRGQTPFTPAVGILLQLNSKLKSIKKIGLDRYIYNIREIALDFRNKIVDLPFSIPVSSLSNALTPLWINKKYSARELVDYLIYKHNIYILPSGGSLEKNFFRIGHIGNISTDMNIILVSALIEAINVLDKKYEI